MTARSPPETPARQSPWAVNAAAGDSIEKWVNRSLGKLGSFRNSFCFRSMSDLSRKPPVCEIAPSRFTGKTFTRRKCFPGSTDDYSIIIDGLRAGRIMKMVRPGQRVVWAWFFHGPYYPTGLPTQWRGRVF
jgi:hypothetical protein